MLGQNEIQELIRTKCPDTAALLTAGEDDLKQEARCSAAIYGRAAAVLACNYKLSASEAFRLMTGSFDQELERRTRLGLGFEK